MRCLCEPSASLLLFAFSLLCWHVSGTASIGSVVNDQFARKIELYRESLPEQLRQQATGQAIAQHLQPTLRFLYNDVWIEVLAQGFVVPELGSLFDGEVAMLFGNITYILEHRQDVSFELSLHMLLATLNSFDPQRYTSILTAYPISRRIVTALLLERYLQAGSFTEAEARIIGDISQRSFQLHKQAARTKRIIEFFHVSKSGGTSFCQLGRLNGCNTESFKYTHNCMITYFRDAPRWTQPGALGSLSQQHGDPWCARFGRNYSQRWHCRARRQHLTKMRFNFYANELVMHDHNRTWAGVHPCREFLNVVIFREPEERMVSHMQNILKEYVRYYNASFWSAFDPASPDQWRALAVPLFDNYVVRSLLGRSFYNAPPGSVNATHLLAAQVVTLQFEVLLTLGATPAAKELTADIFGLGLGWHFDLRHLHARATQERSVRTFAPAVMEAVRAGRRYDQQLYEFALVLQLLDALAFGVAHQVGGPGAAGADSAEGAGQVQVPFLPAARRSAMQGWSGGARMRRERKTCGYVGVRSGTGAKPPPPPAVPALYVEVASGQGLGTERVPVEGLGRHAIGGGRWFNGVFYLNASAAEEAALHATRAAAQSGIQGMAGSA